MDELLKSLNAFADARKWAKGKTWQEIFESCHRGDWLLWLFKRTNPDDLQRLTLAKGHCAKTVYHLMKDERSRRAVDTAIAFGEGKATIKELDAACAAAYAADVDVDADAAAVAAAYAAYAADAAAYAAYAVYDAAYAAYAVYASADAAYAAYAAADARIRSQKETADICRKYLPIEIWNIKP